MFTNRYYFNNSSVGEICELIPKCPYLVTAIVLRVGKKQIFKKKTIDISVTTVLKYW